MSGRLVKVVFKDEIRRVDFAGLSFVSAKKLISERFNLSIDTFSIQYKDAEGDLLTICCDEELEELFQNAGQSIRFFVNIKPAEANAKPAEADAKPAEFVAETNAKLAEADAKLADVNATAAEVEAKEAKPAEVAKCTSSSSTSCKSARMNHCRQREISEKQWALKKQLMQELQRKFASQEKQAKEERCIPRFVTICATPDIPSAAPPQQKNTMPPPLPPQKNTMPPGPPSQWTTLPSENTMPSGEHLQKLLQAGIRSFGLSEHKVYGFLNSLSPTDSNETVLLNFLMSTWPSSMGCMAESQAGSPATTQETVAPSALLPSAPPAPASPQSGKFPAGKWKARHGRHQSQAGGIQYAKELGMLVEMGFYDIEHLNHLLVHHKGDVNAVIACLTAPYPMS